MVSNASNLQKLPRFPMATNYAKMSSFKIKVNSLAMPIKENNVNLVFVQNPPTLTLDFKKPLNKHQKANLQCFASGGVNMVWKSRRKVEITAKKKLTKRRSKYNCTMPSGKKGRFYWYSIQWVDLKKPE
ncbi:Polysaccharide deacetylase family protein [uncultured Candidatus Thioglobus sp.]|nr:Polysaccharide deacetylase family protein [uncultured Candidatus Thioglobus sp.]